MRKIKYYRTRTSAKAGTRDGAQAGNVVRARVIVWAAAWVKNRVRAKAWDKE